LEIACIKILRADETQRILLPFHPYFSSPSLLSETVKIKKLNNLGPTEEEVTGDWRKLYIEELHDVYLSFSELFHDIVNS
jgi:hypothetical protein